MAYIPGPDSIFGFDNLAAGTYKLRLKDVNGCESAIVERTVKSMNCPTPCTAPTFLNNLQIIRPANCGMNDGAIFIVPTSGFTPFMYSIDGGATYVQGPDNIYGFENLSVGTYKLRLKDATGCESAIVERTVTGSISLRYLAISATCGSGGRIIFALPDFATEKYEYSIDGGKTYSSDRFFNNLTPGAYYLIVKYQDCQSVVIPLIVGNVIVRSCLTATTTTAGSVTSAGAPIAFSKEVVNTYPNPSHGQFKVQLQNFVPSKAELSVFDGKGTLIQKRSINLTQNITTDFDLTQKAPGVYYIRIVSGTGTKVSKVTVVK